MHSFDLPFGKAHVFYPEISENYSAASLLLDIDPVGLVRGHSQAAGEGTLDQYVNDRPYVSSSFLSVAMSRVYGTAMGGRSKERQELADMALDWTAVIAVAPCRGGERLSEGFSSRSAMWWAPSGTRSTNTFRNGATVFTTRSESPAENGYRICSRTSKRNSSSA